VTAAFIGAQLMKLVLVDPRARRAFPWLPCAAPRDSEHVGPFGERITILSDGRAEQLATRSTQEET
jgi:hypothetical protein